MCQTGLQNWNSKRKDYFITISFKTKSSMERIKIFARISNYMYFVCSSYVKCIRCPTSDDKLHFLETH